MFNLYINFWANSLETLHHVTQVRGQISADSTRLNRNPKVSDRENRPKLSKNSGFDNLSDWKFRALAQKSLLGPKDK